MNREFAGAKVGLLRRLLLLCIALVAAALFAPAAAPAESDNEVNERSVKAAYLYKFASYVQWPDGTFAKGDTPITFGVIGDSVLADDLAKLVAGRTVDERPLTVRRVKEGDPLDGVQVLFIGRAENARLEHLARAAPGRPILMVTEAEGARAAGSIINFVVAEGRVRFAVSTENADKRSLKLSSRLLTVAQNMSGGEH